MADREKVIYSIERCICHVPDACRDCGYDNRECNECVEELLRDALELLKEQEPERVEIVDSDGGRTHWYVCGGCKTPINPGDRFCHECGRAVKWGE